MKIHFYRIFNNKTVALMALIFIAIEAVPVIGTRPNMFIFIKVALWIFGAVYVGLNKKWAGLYLALLALIYFIIDIVFPVHLVISVWRANASQTDAPYPHFLYFIILGMIIEIVFLSCFLYYGIITSLKDKHN